MGLDMYLRSLPRIEGMDLNDILIASARINQHEQENNEVYQKIKPHIKHFEEFDMKWRSIITDIIYWRKANWIHDWFVENIQGGEDDMSHYEVNREQLLELHNKCIEVLAQDNPPWAVLPTRPGPFFGSTSYDSYYFYEIERTKNLLADILQNFNFETHYILYHANW